TYGSSLFLTLTLDHHLTHFFLLALLTLKFTLFPYTTLFRSGCSLFQSDELTLPHKFRDQSAYHLSDFHLNGQYTYWEVRRNGIPDTTTHETIRSYDNSIYESLSSGQRQKIKAATTQREIGRASCRERE